MVCLTNFCHPSQPIINGSLLCPFLFFYVQLKKNYQGDLMCCKIKWGLGHIFEGVPHLFFNATFLILQRTASTSLKWQVEVWGFHLPDHTASCEEMKCSSRTQRLRCNLVSVCSVYKMVPAGWERKASTAGHTGTHSRPTLSCPAPINALLCRGRHYIRAKTDLNFTLRQKSDLNISI